MSNLKETIKEDFVSVKNEANDALKNENRKKMNKICLRTGLTIFLVGLALIICSHWINNPGTLGQIFDKIIDILNPFIIGFVIAYLLCPIYNWIARGIYHATKPRIKKPGRAMTFSRILSTILTMLLLVAFLTGMVWLVVPDLIKNIMSIVPKIEPAFNNIIAWVEENVTKNPQISEILAGRLDNISDSLIKWVQNKVLPEAQNVLSSVSTGVITAISTLVDFIIALVVCVYVLNSKEIFKAQSQKIILANCKPERAESIFELGKMANANFGGFINGKILDSIIIGILCFIIMTILKIPTAALISVIVGVTNVIPFFGPFIGAIPSAFILILVDPMGCLKFIIMILLLQQFDGNILSPAIVGRATKLSSFWVLFAIMLFGGLFGVIGMIIGVPVFALIYTYIERAVNRRLEKKGLETDTLSYEDFSRYTDDPKEIVKSHKLMKEEENKKARERKNIIAIARDKKREEKKENDK